MSFILVIRLIAVTWVTCHQCHPSVLLTTRKETTAVVTQWRHVCKNVLGLHFWVGSNYFFSNVSFALRNLLLEFCLLITTTCHRLGQCCNGDYWFLITTTCHRLGLCCTGDSSIVLHLWCLVEYWRNWWLYWYIMTTENELVFTIY